MLKGTDDAYAIIDDILIAGDDLKRHDEILKKVVSRATEYNFKLNFDKCKIRQKCMTYMGQLLTNKELKPDPEKIGAIIEMPPPQDKEGIRRFLGFVQYLSKFIPNPSQVDAPLRVLLKSDVKFEWNHGQEQSFSKFKKLCTSPPVLAFYDVHKDVEIECDASKDGLGLLQSGKVVAYASCALTGAEKCYAQLEKEMLSIVYSVGKFHCYVFGKEVTVYQGSRLTRKPGF